MASEQFMRHHYGASGYVKPEDREPTTVELLDRIERCLQHEMIESPCEGDQHYYPKCSKPEGGTQ